MQKKILMKGNEALSEGAILAGCRYYFGYPITPQSEIPEYLAKRLPDVNGVFLQAESEIAAINMVYGAASCGARSMTSSSSPGISLKQETISSLAAAELPCVIVNITRGGPGLGSIQGAQSDYFQTTKGGGHGDYRLLAYAPASAQEMLDLTMRAFEKADQYRIPTIILGDGVLGQMMEPVSLPDPVKSFPSKPWATTGTRGRDHTNVIKMLYLDQYECEQMNYHLQAKYDEITANEVLFEEHQTEDADWIIVGYGISARLALSAMNLAREAGIKAGVFRPITLWPFPSMAIKTLAKRVKGFLVVEQNMGQMVEDVKLASEFIAPVHFYGRPGGVLPDPMKIFEELMLCVKKGEA